MATVVQKHQRNINLNKSPIDYFILYLHPQKWSLARTTFQPPSLIPHRIHLIFIHHVPIRIPFTPCSTIMPCLSFSSEQHFLLLRGSPRGGNSPNLGPPDTGGSGLESSLSPSVICTNEICVSQRDQVGYQKLIITSTRMKDSSLSLLSSFIAWGVYNGSNDGSLGLGLGIGLEFRV